MLYVKNFQPMTINYKKVRHTYKYYINTYKIIMNLRYREKNKKFHFTFNII